MTSLRVVSLVQSSIVPAAWYILERKKTQPGFHWSYLRCNWPSCILRAQLDDLLANTWSVSTKAAARHLKSLCCNQLFYLSMYQQLNAISRYWCKGRLGWRCDFTIAIIFSYLVDHVFSHIFRALLMGCRIMLKHLRNSRHTCPLQQGAESKTAYWPCDW